MRLPATKTLVKTAIYGGVICISTVMYARSRIEDRIRQTDYFRTAMRTLRTHHGAVQLLGEPIKEKGFDLGDPARNFCTAELAQFEVKVGGPKDKGTVFFWAERADSDDDSTAAKLNPKWLVKRMELEVDSIPDRRLVVVKGASASATAAVA